MNFNDEMPKIVIVIMLLFITSTPSKLNYDQFCYSNTDKIQLEWGVVIYATLAKVFLR